MATLKEQIKERLNRAMKDGDELTRSVLRMLLAAILNKELASKSGLKDSDILEIISSEAKKRRESVSAYEKGGRKDLAEKEKKEIEILQKYLPEQLSEKEIQKIVDRAVKKTGAKEIKDMGKVMKEIMPQVKGRVDGSLASRIIKERLSKSE